jgi:hypothetical protein
MTVARPDRAAPVQVRVKKVYISPLLYQYLRNMHREALALLDSLDTAIDHEEHRQMFEKGLRNGYILPDIADFRRRMDEFRQHLDSYNPRGGRSILAPGDDGVMKDYVVLPQELAANLLRTAIRSTEFTGHFISQMKISEYFPWLREIKAAGEPYMGPNSLGEMCSLYFTLQLAESALKKHGALDRLPANWARRMG